MRYFSSAVSSRIQFRVICIANAAFFFACFTSLNVALAQRETAIKDISSIASLRANLKAFLKNSKRDSEPEIQHAAILNLCQLHHWVVSDPRFLSSDALQGIRATSAARLTSFSKELETALKRKNRGDQRSKASRVTNASAGRSSFVKNTDELHSTSTKPLQAESSLNLDELIFLSRVVAENTSDSLHGGPGQILNYLGGSFGPDADHAAELIALIQSTIDPQFWRVNGGPGTIHYYRPGLALVVTASQEVQDRVRTLLLRLK